MTAAADALLARLSTSCEQAEVYASSVDTLEVKFTGGAVKTAVARESSGLAGRAIRAGRLGFAGSRDLSDDGRSRLVQNVEDSLGVGDESGIVFPSASDVPAAVADLRLYDEATAGLEVGDLLAAATGALETLKERHPSFVFDATIRRATGTGTLRNSAGGGADHRGTSCSFSVEANRTSEADVLLDFAYRVARSRGALDLDGLVEELSQRLTWSEETVELRPGKLPVLFTPAGSLVLWSPLLHALGGKTVMLGTSPLREKLGERIFDERVSLVDDGLLPGGLGTSLYDDEGLPRRRTALVEGGVLRSFVHDLETAHATGHEPTANGERGGVLGRPVPSFSNLVWGGGAQAQADMLAGIEYGLLVHSVMGMGQGNTLPGNFSNPVDLGFLIEGGQIKGRVKDVSIAGNIYELLDGQLGGLSREVEPIYGAYHLPWLQIDDVNVVGKASA